MVLIFVKINGQYSMERRIHIFKRVSLISIAKKFFIIKPSGRLDLEVVDEVCPSNSRLPM